MFQHAAARLHAMIETRIAGNIENRAAGARFFVPGAKNHARNARKPQRARAHRARLQSHIKRDAFQIVLIESLRRRLQRQNFSVRNRIFVDFAPIIAAPNDFLAQNANRANWNVIDVIYGDVTY